MEVNKKCKALQQYVITLQECVEGTSAWPGPDQEGFIEDMRLISLDGWVGYPWSKADNGLKVKGIPGG